MIGVVDDLAFFVFWIWVVGDCFVSFFFLDTSMVVVDELDFFDLDDILVFCLFLDEDRLLLVTQLCGVVFRALGIMIDDIVALGGLACRNYVMDL